MRENVRIVSMVVAKLKLRDVQREVFSADPVIRSHDPALDERPETIDCLRVNRANHVLTFAVINCPKWKLFAEAVISCIVIAAKQINFSRNGLADKPIESGAFNVLNHARDDVALAGHSASDWSLARVAEPTFAASLIRMTITVLPADPSFVDLDNPHELTKFGVNQGATNAMAHIPSGAVRTEAHVAMNLECANSLLARQHKVNDAEPLPKINLCVLKDRSRDVRKTVCASFSAIWAFPMPFARLKWINLVAT